MLLPKTEPMKVASSTAPGKLAGSIAESLRQTRIDQLQTIGAGALNQALKGLSGAKEFLIQEGRELVFFPSFRDLLIDYQDRTAIRTTVLSVDSGLFKTISDHLPKHRETLRVASDSDRHAVATAIAGYLKEDGAAYVQTIGAAAANVAAKAIAIARGRLIVSGILLLCSVTMDDIMVDGRLTTVIILEAIGLDESFLEELMQAVVGSC